MAKTYPHKAAQMGNMPHCDNCSSFVTAQYVRVFAPTGLDTVRVCPNCEDIIRDGADVRQTHSVRR